MMELTFAQTTFCWVELQMLYLKALSWKLIIHAIGSSFVKESLMPFGGNGHKMSYHNLPHGKNGIHKIEM